MAEIKQKLRAFNVPNYIMSDTGQPPEQESKYHISEVPVEALEEMCEAFKAEILRKHNSPAP